MARKSGSRVFVWIILGLLFVGLLGFGANSFSGSIRTVATVGDKEITVAGYQRALNDQIRALEAQIGQPMTFQEAQSLGVDQAVVGQLVTQRVLDNQAAELGISVGDARVREEVLRVPAFRTLSGDFDRDAYRDALRRIGLTVTEFEAGIRDDVSRTILQGAVVGGVPVPDAYADTLLRFVAERREITYARVTESTLGTPVPGPTDADLQAYYDANPDAFTLPEMREITYAAMLPDDLQAEITVDEQSLQDLYQERIEDFVRPERRLVERLAFVDDAAATAALERVTAGEADFDALVTERGLELSDVDLGDLAQDQLGAAGEAVFAAAVGDVVGPFETDLGPALFRVNAVLAAEEVPFDEARDDLAAELANDQARAAISADAERITDLLAGGATLEDLAEQTAMTLGTISWSEDVQDGIAAYDSFRAAAATVAEGDFPELVELADGGVVALRLDGVTPPALQPFDTVRDAVESGWRAERTQELVLARAAELQAEIGPETDFTALELTPQTGAGLSRSTFIDGTPPDFIAQVFEMAPGETRVVDNGTDALLVRLDGVSAPDTEDPTTQAQRAEIANQAVAGIANDLYAAFANAVQARTDISINQSAINAVNAQLQ